MNTDKDFLEKYLKATREQAKALYKAWQITPDDGKLLQRYSEAWQRHQDANISLFLHECGAEDEEYYS